MRGIRSWCGRLRTKDSEQVLALGTRRSRVLGLPSTAASLAIQRALVRRNVARELTALGRGRITFDRRPAALLLAAVRRRRWRHARARVGHRPVQPDTRVDADAFTGRRREIVEQQRSDDVEIARWDRLRAVGAALEGVAKAVGRLRVEEAATSVAIRIRAGVRENPGVGRPAAHRACVTSDRARATIASRAYRNAAVLRARCGPNAM